MVTPTAEHWDRQSTFSVCALDALGDHLPPNVAGYCALLLRAPDRREALLCIDYAPNGVFEQIRQLLTTENPVKWANPTHAAFEVLPPEDPANHDELTARHLRLSTLVADLNPRFKG
jgi:hypothetical protein